MICVAVLAGALWVSKWAFGHAAALNAVQPEVAEFAVGLAPGDPRAHYEFGLLLEKSFLPEDESAALREFEKAAELSPNSYGYWMAVGSARERSGEVDGAEAALRTAAELAPNYSRVRWALGNLLLRTGRRDEGFREIRSAVASDASFADPAASAAWSLFGGDVDRVRGAVGDSSRINASLAVMLASEKRYSEALNFWSRVPIGETEGPFRGAAQMLYGKFVEAGLYRSAVEVATRARLLTDHPAEVGAVWNGGFEEGYFPNDTFGWTFADANSGRVGFNKAQVHSGTYSLLLNFGQGSREFLSVSQRVGVEPGRRYTLSFFYRSELKTNASVVCQISAPNGKRLAAVPVGAASDWAEAKAELEVPPDVEGIEIKITSEGCPGQGCTFAGNIWFDDFSLKAAADR